MSERPTCPTEKGDLWGPENSRVGHKVLLGKGHVEEPPWKHFTSWREANHTVAFLIDRYAHHLMRPKGLPALSRSISPEGSRLQRNISACTKVFGKPGVSITARFETGSSISVLLRMSRTLLRSSAGSPATACIAQNQSQHFVVTSPLIHNMIFPMLAV